MDICESISAMYQMGKSNLGIAWFPHLLEVHGLHDVDIYVRVTESNQMIRLRLFDETF